MGVEASCSPPWTSRSGASMTDPSPALVARSLLWLFGSLLLGPAHLGAHLRRGRGEIGEELGFGDLGDRLAPLGLIDLDREHLDLADEAALARADLGRHRAEGFGKFGHLVGEPAARRLRHVD